MAGRRFPRAPQRRSASVILVALLAGLSAGCAQTGAMATVPRGWRKDNPWSPEAWEARARGELKPLFYTQQMAEWAAFARDHLQDGDILLRYGTSGTIRGRLANRLLTGVSDSAFTHDAIVFHEAGKVFVYDNGPAPENSVRKLPFEFWMLGVVPGTLTVLRVRPPFQNCIPAALAYCEDAWLRQVPFDSAMRLDDYRLYCTEMIEKAYRSAGLALSDPLPIRCLPRYNHYRWLRSLVERFTEIRVDEPLFALGNACYGVYSSPYLELVYGGDPCQHRRAPICHPVPYPADGPCPFPASLPPSLEK